MTSVWLGFSLILGVGVVITAVAALADRRTRRRTEGLDAADAGVHDADRGSAPAYLATSELLRREPPSSKPGSAAMSDATPVELTLADPRLAGDDGRSQVADPLVLVCDDPVTTVRELVPVWAFLRQQQAVTVAAPSFGADVLEAMVVNTRGGTHVVLGLVGEAFGRAKLAELTGATIVDRADRQAGAVPGTALGHAKAIAAGKDGTLVSPSGFEPPLQP